VSATRSVPGDGRNPLNWNTIYTSRRLQHRPFVRRDADRRSPRRPRPADVNVNSQVPSGIPTATVTSVGSGCGACSRSFYELRHPATMDLGGHSMKLVLSSRHLRVSTGTERLCRADRRVLNLTDDSFATVSLPFSLPYPASHQQHRGVLQRLHLAGDRQRQTPTSPSLVRSWRGCRAWHRLDDFLPMRATTSRVDSSASVVRVTWQASPTTAQRGTSTMQCSSSPTAPSP